MDNDTVETFIENILSDEAVNEICTVGCNEDAVNKWTHHYLPKLKELPDTEIYKFLQLQGFEDSENYMTSVKCALWVVAWNKFENRYK